MRPANRIALLFLLVVTLAGVPAGAEWRPLGDMPRPTRQGKALRFANAQGVVIVTVLSPDIIRV